MLTTSEGVMLTSLLDVGTSPRDPFFRRCTSPGESGVSMSSYTLTEEVTDFSICDVTWGYKDYR